jgi:hypothetical protein
MVGNGNGNMTISNTKNSSAHGPCKRIISELSKLVPVIIVDEYMTSQTCHRCTVGGDLIYPKMHHRKPYRRMLKDMFNKVPKTREEYKNLVRKHNLVNIQVPYNKQVHGLCYCKNKIHRHIDGSLNRLWNRDNQSSKCIFKAGLGRLIGERYIAFERKEEDE